MLEESLRNDDLHVTIIGASRVVLVGCVGGSLGHLIRQGDGFHISKQYVRDWIARKVVVARVRVCAHVSNRSPRCGGVRGCPAPRWSRTGESVALHRQRLVHTVAQGPLPRARRRRSTCSASPARLLWRPLAPSPPVAADPSQREDTSKGSFLRTVDAPMQSQPLQTVQSMQSLPLAALARQGWFGLADWRVTLTRAGSPTLFGSHATLLENLENATNWYSR